MGTPQLKGLPPRPTPPWHIRENRLMDGSATYDVVSREGVEIYALDRAQADRLAGELNRASDYYVPEVKPPEKVWRCHDCHVSIDDPERVLWHQGLGHDVREVAS